MDQEQESPGKGAVCAKCGASFENQEELDRHVASEHGGGDGDEGTGQGEQPADR